MTATLFQIHSDITDLPNKLKKLLSFCQEDDNVVLLGRTATFIEWLTQQEDKAIIELFSRLPKLNWYALSTDINSEQNSIDGIKYDLLFINEKIKVITDEDWVDLTNNANKVVSIY